MGSRFLLPATYYLLPYRQGARSMNGTILRSESGNFLIRGHKISATQKREFRVDEVVDISEGIVEFQ